MVSGELVKQIQIWRAVCGFAYLQETLFHIDKVWTLPCSSLLLFIVIVTDLMRGINEPNHPACFILLT